MAGEFSDPVSHSGSQAVNNSPDFYVCAGGRIHVARDDSYQMIVDNQLLFQKPEAHHYSQSLARRAGELVSFELLEDETWGKPFGAEERALQHIVIVRNILKTISVVDDRLGLPKVGAVRIFAGRGVAVTSDDPTLIHK